MARNLRDKVIVITGASRPSQVVENFAAVDLLDQLTPDVLAEIDRALGTR